MAEIRLVLSLSKFKRLYQIHTPESVQKTTGFQIQTPTGFQFQTPMFSISHSYYIYIYICFQFQTPI